MCGGLLSGTTGRIESYNFGQTNYTEKIECFWEIRPESRRELTLAFYFDVFEVPRLESTRDKYSRCYKYYFGTGKTNRKLTRSLINLFTFY